MQLSALCTMEIEHFNIASIVSTATRTLRGKKQATVMNKRKVS